ncbi:MAG: hypothetical protein QW568_05450 [Candidatus Anstonellaceae archaeon]
MQFSHHQLLTVNPNSKSYHQTAFLDEKLAKVQSIAGLQSILSRYHSNILKLGVHVSYFNSKDLKEFNEIVSANGWDKTLVPTPILSPAKLTAYEEAVSTLFKTKADFENAFFVVEIPKRRTELKLLFERHGAIFVPKKDRLIYSPQARLQDSAAENRIAHRNLVQSLKAPDLKVVFVFGVYLSQCVKNAVISVKNLLHEIKREDVKIAISHLVAKDVKEFV